MEPTEAIRLAEVILRDLVRTIMGDAWMQDSAFDRDRDKLPQKLKAEQAKRRGSYVSEDLLDYTEFEALTTLIVKTQWSRFAPALGGKQEYMRVYLDRLAGLRNAAMHSRELLPHERALVQGIVGEIRNLVTIYRSSMGPDMQYYPTIELITDNLGTSAGPTSGGTVQTGTRLRVGDEVSFTCRARDPQGRELNWQVESFPSDGTVVTASGDEVVLTWTFTERHVRENMQLFIRLTSSGRYHRHGTLDDSRFFRYSVDPPVEREQG